MTSHTEHSVLERLEKSILSFPNALAFKMLDRNGSEQGRLTHLELHEWAQAIANSIRSKCSSGDRVVIALPNSLEFVAVIIACMFARVIAVPAPTPKRRLIPRLQAILEDSGAKLVVCQEAQFQIIELSDRTNSVGVLDPTNIEKVGNYEAGEAISSHHPAIIQYTSGSTSKPKGVVVTHGNLLSNQHTIQSCFAHGQEARYVGWAPFFHDLGLVSNILQPIFLGASCTILSPIDVVQKPALWLETISKERATVSGGPNFIYDHCTDKITDDQAVEFDLSSWHAAFNGSEPIRAETLKRFVKRFTPFGFREEAFLPCYGLAEATLMVTGRARGTGFKVLELDDKALEYDGVARFGGERKLVSSGTSWFDVGVKIRSVENGNPLPEKQVGEVCITGSGVTAGYWDQRTESVRKFQSNETASTEQELGTGDLGFLFEDELYVTGRIKDIIIVRGRKIAAEDVEWSIENRFDFVQPGGVVAFSVEGDLQEQLCIVVEVKRTRSSLTQDAMSAAIRRVVTTYHDLAIANLVFVRPGQVPRTSSGKRQRAACRRLYLDGVFQVSRVKKTHLQTEAATS